MSDEGVALACSGVGYATFLPARIYNAISEGRELLVRGMEAYIGAAECVPSTTKCDRGWKTGWIIGQKGRNEMTSEDV